MKQTYKHSISTPKQQAINDIKQDLKSSDKCFICYQSRLNQIMRKLVSNYIKAQQEL